MIAHPVMSHPLKAATRGIELFATARSKSGRSE